MTPELARSLLDLVADPLQRLEARAGRRAVRISVAIPAHLDPAVVRETLEAMFAKRRSSPLDIEVTQEEGRPRLLTVDFELQEPS
ncbi:MAG: hypothetical protein R3F61_20670 [Myxococcota bacterium]